MKGLKLLSGLVLAVLLFPVLLAGRPSPSRAAPETSVAYTAPVYPDAIPASRSDVSGTVITDTTWMLTSSPYVVTGDVTVNPGVTLSVEPGVEVRFDGNYALNVRGTLDVEGTEMQQIRFTSNQASPAPGDWAMIDFRSESAFNVLEHAIIEYGGNASRAGWNCLAGALCVNTTSFLLEDSTVQHNATRGLVLSQSDAIISNSVFDDHVEEAIRLHSCDHNIGPCRPTIFDNSFTNSARAILRHGAFDPFVSGNQAHDNEINGFFVEYGSVFLGDNTWYADDLTYVVDWGCAVGNLGPATLRIEPGTVVKFVDNGSLTFVGSSVIAATGTADRPIFFTSLKDDSVGGDSNSDGNVTAPAAGDWFLVTISGADARGLFEHAVFRYGGGWEATGAILGVDHDSAVTVRRCDVSHSPRHGIYVWRGADAQIEESVIHDNDLDGVNVYTEGEVVLAGNRFLDNAQSGVHVGKGQPTVRDNFFQGNAIGVNVNCPSADGCAPVISAHNRFVGNGNQAIRNRFPRDVCVEAVYNWWGDKAGPDDPSSVQDPCGLVDNPGSGAAVSDGVNYSPWEGGVARPLIARPGCGMTARNQPTFVGRAQAGATVSFYDGDGLLGQTMCGADHTFTWTPTEPLTDGLHLITANATMGSESSLPSPELPLRVDSTLPFDPAGVRISYRFHSVLYTQTLRDASGCASVTGDLSAAIAVRPGSLMTIVVPLRTDLVQARPSLTCAQDLGQSSSSTSGGMSPASELVRTMSPFRSNIGSEPEWQTVTYENTDNLRVGYVRVAPKGRQAFIFNNILFDRYGAKQLVGDFDNGGTGTLTLTQGQYDISFWENKRRMLHRRFLTIDPGKTHSPYPVRRLGGGGLIKVIMRNRTGRVIDIRALHFARWDFDYDVLKTGIVNLGGSLTSSTKLRDQRGIGIHLPQDLVCDYVMVMREADDTVRFRRVKAWEDTDEILFYELTPPVNVTITNNFQKNICAIVFVRPEHDSDDVRFRVSKRLNLLTLFRDKLLQGDQHKLQFKMEGGVYNVYAYDCDGKPVEKRKGVNLWNPPKPGRWDWNIDGNCQTGIRLNDTFSPLLCPTHTAVASAAFLDCSASVPVAPGPLRIEVCDEDGTQHSTGAGQVLVDPDGYVYDADLGLEEKIQGATVTCDVFDEDYQSWDRWPAELYESQINPQITGDDGYYAFFVPSGLYRVRAQASGYESHTSPDIRVISEIVHYNIPMEGGDYPVYVPLILRSSQ